MYKGCKQFLKFFSLFMLISLFSACFPFDPVINNDPQEAEQLVDEGITLMKDGNWDDALNSFSQAAAKDPDNGEAVLWYSALNMASIAVDDDMTSLVRTRLGMQGYPSTMNTLYSPDWLYDYSGNLAPEINIPPAIAAFEDNNAAIITYGEYMLGLLYNMVTANPNGFNELFDTVVDDILGPRLDLAVSTIDLLDNSAKISFTWQMFTEQTTCPESWPRDANNVPLSISIGKAELLLEAASLQNMRAMLTLCKAISKSLPLLEYWNAFNPIDGSLFANTLDWGNLTNPFEDGFLFDRDNYAAILADAKISFLKSTGFAINGLNGILANRQGYFLSSYTPGMSTQWSDLVTVLSFYKNLFTKIESSINSNTTLVLPIPTYDEIYYTIDYEAYFTIYSNAGNWPVTADSSQGFIGINFATIFETPFYTANFLFDFNEITGEPKWYAFDAGYTNNIWPPTSFTLSSAVAATSIDPYSQSKIYAFKIKDLTLNGCFTLDDSTLALLKDRLSENYQIDGIGDQLVVENPDGSVSVYIPCIPACFAYTSLAPAGEALTINYTYLTTPFDFTTKGSFWWNLFDFNNFASYVDLTYEAPLVAGVLLENQYIDSYSNYYYEADGLDPASYYQIKIIADSDLGKSISTASGPYGNEIITGTDSIFVQLFSYDTPVNYSIELVECQLTSGASLTSQTILGYENDYYVLTMDTLSSYTLNLSNLSADVNVSIYEDIDGIYYIISDSDSDTDGIITFSGLTGYPNLFVTVANNNGTSAVYDLSFAQE